MSRFHTLYNDVVVPELTKKFGYKTIMQVPRITKITLNMGVGEAVNDKKMVDNAVADMTKIAGQKPAVTRTRKAIANFKIREDMPIGCKVTLRGERMYDFLDRLVTIAFPRVRDFRGVSGRAFDGRGNYNIGLKEQIIFPEIEYDKIDAIRGMNISITTTAKTDEEAARKLAEKRKYQSEATVRCYQKMKADAEAGDPEAIRRYEATLAKRRDEYHKKKARQEEVPA